MDWSNKIVLIAEDDYTNFMLLEEYLEPTGIQIFHASNGFEVLEILKNTMPDIILLDIKMPIMNGYELLNQLQKENLHIPVIAQTAYAMKGDEELLLSSGCVDYISKPINENILLFKMANSFSTI